MDFPLEADREEEDSSFKVKYTRYEYLVSTTNGSVRHCIYRLGQALASAFLSAATVPYYYGLAATRERSRYCLLSLSYFKYEERKLSKARGFLSYYYGYG